MQTLADGPLILTPQASAAAPARILVCEDNVLLSEMLGHHLRAGGHDVLFAADGGAATAMIANERPDAVILDAMMPVRSGYEVLRQMMDDETLAEIPVLMLTGLSKEGDVVDALALGASEFMLKPFNPEELIARLDRLLQRTREKPDD